MSVLEAGPEENYSSEAECPTLWIVVPCYNEEAVLPETSEYLVAKLDSLITRGMVSNTSRILLVDDGSRDDTWHQIEALHAGKLEGVSIAPGVFCGLKLAHNAGHQNALYAGLMYARFQGCDCAVSIDADLQDDINAIDEMVDCYRSGAEIVYGVRSNRDADTRFKRATAKAFYGLMHVLGVEMVSDSADYRLMGKRSLGVLAEFKEANLFLRGIVPSLGFASAKVYCRRGERFAGESKYPLRKMISFALEGITSFSIVPVRLIALIGVLAIVISVLMIIYALVSLAMDRVVAGWTSLMVSVWLVGGLIMTSLGIVGEYVGRTYLEAKGRPRYIIDEVLD